MGVYIALNAHLICFVVGVYLPRSKVFDRKLRESNCGYSSCDDINPLEEQSLIELLLKSSLFFPFFCRTP